MMNYMRVILANQKRRNIMIEKQSFLHHFEKKKTTTSVEKMENHFALQHQLQEFLY